MPGKLSTIIPFTLVLLLAACNPATLASSPSSTEITAPIKTTTVEPAIIQPTTTPVTKVTIFFVAGGDKGRSGKPIGCNDSIIPVEFEIQPSEDPIRSALELLFSFKDQLVGPVKLYNSLYQSHLTVDDISITTTGEAEVHLKGEYLLGGVCDNPRFKAQIEETVLSFDQVTSVKVYINGIGLDQILSGD